MSTNAVGNSRQHKPALDRDAIRWQTIDGPRSLMIAWKKLIATSARFRQESKDYLQHQTSSKIQRRWNVVAYAKDGNDEGSEEEQDDEASPERFATHNVEWT